MISVNINLTLASCPYDIISVKSIQLSKIVVWSGAITASIWEWRSGISFVSFITLQDDELSGEIGTNTTTSRTRAKVRGVLLKVTDNYVIVN